MLTGQVVRMWQAAQGVIPFWVQTMVSRTASWSDFRISSCLVEAIKFKGASR